MNAKVWMGLVLGLTCTVWATEEPRSRGANKPAGDDDDPRSMFLSDIPSYSGNVILARPTDHSVTANVMLNRSTSVQIFYSAEGQGERHSDIVELKAGEAREIILDDLPPDRVCRYRLEERGVGDAAEGGGFSGVFHTRRSPDSTFTFSIQADSHLDGSCVPALYTRSLGNVMACKPDFHIDLGDTFMTGKISTRDEAAKQYLAQRYYLGLIGHSVPMFMVIGNHDGEEVAKHRAGDADTLAVWSCRQRKRFFSNPIPDAFYTGNTATNLHVGPVEDYYAWEWGNALFVVLDPYWYSRGNIGGSEPWNMTLGKCQYDWLARTLRQSRAGFKFVFIHQLVGGLDKGGRGGAEAAPLFEWGGHEKDGSDTFASHRPEWEMPIHKLLVETGVSAVFHGHDHFFAHQELDGIVYQLVPQPAHRNSTTHQASEYGYRHGEFIPNSGFLSVKVSATTATVVYVRSFQGTSPEEATQGIVSSQYAILAKPAKGAP